MVFEGQGRNRLCLAAEGERAGIITYAAGGDSNCSVRGRLSGGAIAPDGDELCRIPVVRSDGKISLGEAGPECAYYCAPSASLAGKTFVRMENGSGAVDLAGDPLC